MKCSSEKRGLFEVSLPFQSTFIHRSGPVFVPSDMPALCGGVFCFRILARRKKCGVLAGQGNLTARQRKKNLTQLAQKKQPKCSGPPKSFGEHARLGPAGPG